MKKYNDRSIKEVISEFIGKNERVSKGIHTTRLTDIWKQEMGPIISSYTEKLIFKENVVKVYLTSAPLRKELSMGKPQIIKILNEAIGSEIVTDIEFH
ncbi:MAG: DUF721 domain-containing protein [Saprospiraceae bacterium]|nr:DUF721 domain-containing protein [Saprospiraceae bacterium]